MNDTPKRLLRVVNVLLDIESKVKFHFPQDGTFEEEWNNAETLEQFVRRIVRDEIERAFIEFQRVNKSVLNHPDPINPDEGGAE